MSLISGSYSRACGGGGAPDCRGDMVENCLRAGVVVVVAIRGEAWVERGARARALAGKAVRMFLVAAVRRLRLRVDIVFKYQLYGGEERSFMKILPIFNAGTGFVWLVQLLRMLALASRPFSICDFGFWSLRR